MVDCTSCEALPPGFEWSHNSPEMWAGETCDADTWCLLTGGQRNDIADLEELGISPENTGVLDSGAIRSASCNRLSKNSLFDSAFANVGEFQLV
jgi:hypothetical protein